MTCHVPTSHLNLEAALGLAALGILVIPCRPTKAPYPKDWPNAGTTDEAKIRQWWRQWPDAIPGLPCGTNGFLVVDCDRKNGLDGMAEWDSRCADQALDYTSCVIVETPSSGRHVYFRQGDGPPLRNSAGKIGDGIDTRGDGGQVIAPGAVLPDGRSYRLLSGSFKSLPVVRDDLRSFLLSKELELPAVVKLPQNTPDIVEGERPYALSILRNEAQKVVETNKGSRNHALNTAAFLVGTVLPSGGIMRSEVEAELTRAALIAGLETGETTLTIKSGIDSGMSQPRPSIAVQDAAKRQGVSIVGLNDASPPNISPQAIKWLDPKPLPSSLTPVDDFDPYFLPATIAPWVMDIAERMQCPPDYVAVSEVVALGAAIGRQIGIRPKPKDDWTVTPNLWGMIVGRPGVMKSPAMGEALWLLKTLEAKAREAYLNELRDYRTIAAQFELRKTAAKNLTIKQLRNNPAATISISLPAEPIEPKQKRFIASDATYEALGEILAHNPNGVLAFRDELVALLKTLDREENAAACGFFMTGWNGADPYTFDRIVRGHQHIEAVCLSMLGSTQPGRLANYIGHALRGGDGDNGMIQRFSLMVWPDQPSHWCHVDRAPDAGARDAAARVFERLSALHTSDVRPTYDSSARGPYLTFDDPAVAQFIDWLTDLEHRLRSGELHVALESHFAKYRKLVPALALINHLADGGTGAVPPAALARAIAFSRYLEGHARRAYGAGLRMEAVTAAAILIRIRKGELANPFTLRDIHQRDWSNLTDRGQVQAGLDLLVDFDWLVAQRIDTGGRPKTVFHVNPKAWA